MANPNLKKVISDLEQFIQTVDRARGSADQAATVIEKMLTHISKGWYTTDLRKAAEAFNTLLRNTTAAENQIRKAKNAMDELARSSSRFADVQGMSDVQRESYYEAVRPAIRSRRTYSRTNLRTFRAFEPLMTAQQDVVAGGVVDDVRDLFRSLTSKGASKQNFAGLEEKALGIIQREGNRASDEIVTRFAREIEKRLKQLSKGKFVTTALSESATGRAQYREIMKGVTPIFGEKDTAKQFQAVYGQEVSDKVTNSIKKYGLALENIKSVQKELSTGTTRIDFAKEWGKGTGVIERLNLTLDKHGNILEDTQKRYRTFGDAVLRDIKEVAKWTIAVAVVYAPIRKLGELIQQMIVNQSKLADVQIATTQTAEEMGVVFDRLAVVADQTGETIAGTIDAYKLAYQAAGNIADPHIRAATATKLLADTLVLSKLSGMEHAQAMDVLSGALKQVGMDLTQGSVLLDKWVAVSKAANVNIATLAQSFVITSTAAENVGIDVDKLNGIIAAVSEVTNKSAEETGNMVRAFISGFQTDNARDELAKYGISIYDAEGRLREFMDVMIDVRSMMDTGLIREDEAAKLAEVLGGGARRGAQYAAFFQNLPRVQQIATVSANAAGDAYAALEIKLNTVETASTRLANAFTSLAQAMGTEGGMLDNATKVLDILTGIVETMTKLTSLLGRSAPILATLGISGLYMSRNPGTKASLGGGLANLLYNPALMFGRLLNKNVEDTSAGAGFLPSEYYAKTKTYQRMQQDPTAPTSQNYWNQRLRSEGFIPISASEKAADKMATTFVGKVKGNIGNVMAIGAVALTTILQASAGEWGEAAASSLGAGIGAGLSVAVLGSLNPIMIILGQVLGEAFYNTFIKYTPDLGQTIADSMVRAVQEETPEQAKKTREQEELERLTSDVFQAIGRGVTPPAGRAGRPLKADEAERVGERAIGGSFELGIPFRRGREGAFDRLIKRWVEGTIPTDQALEYAVNEALRSKGLEEDQYAILKALSGAYGDSAKEAAIRLLDEMKTRAIGTGAGLREGVSGPVAERVSRTEQRFRKEGVSYVEAGRKDIFKQLQFGEISPTDYSKQIENLRTLDNTVASVYANLLNLDETKDIFDEMDDSVNGSTESYKKLADVIVNLTPEERDEILKLSQGLNDLYLNFLKTGQGASEYAAKQLELINLLQGISAGQFTREFQAPTIFELPEGMTQTALNELIAGAEALQNQYLETFVPNPETRAKIIAEYAKLAVLIGSTFAGSIEGIGTEFLNKFLQTMQEEGTAPTGQQMQIRRLDIPGSQIPALERSIDKWTEFIRQQFPGYKFNIQEVGVIATDNQTKVLHTDNLVMQLAMQELIDVNKKQLDGIYNLPADASFYVPFQGYKLGFQDGGGGGGGISGTGAPATTETPTVETPTRPAWATEAARLHRERVLQREQRLEELEKIKDIAKPTAPFPDRRFEQKQELAPPPDDSALTRLLETLVTFFKKLNIGGVGSIPTFGLDQPEGLKSMPKDIEKVQTTSLKLDITSNIQLTLDGRMLATIMKQYLYEDMIRSEGIAGSINRSIVI